MINIEDNDLDVSKIEAFLKENLNSANNERKTLVLSNEQIAGLPVLWPAAYRIKRFLPQSKILICIREQRALIESYYIYQSRNLGGIFGVPDRYYNLPIRFDEYLSFHFPDGEENELKSQKFLRLCWRLKYMKLATLYQELFGRQNVLVLPIEMADRNPKEFAARLEEFCNIEADETAKLLGLKKRNVAVQKDHIVYERWRRHLPERIAFSNYIPFGKRVRELFFKAASMRSDQVVSWNECNLKKLSALYSNQNQQINDEYNLDLSKYKYLMG